MKLLLTGFDPFGGETVNPAYEAVKLVPDTVAGIEIIKLEIPTVFEKGAAKVLEAMRTQHPDFVLCIGQAGGRHNITPEVVGINLREARIPDNEGNQPFEERIRKDGETAYFSTLPIKRMVRRMTANGIPSALSYTAGSYVCNDVLYTLMYNISKEFPAMKGGFIHVPYATQQAVGKPGVVASMSVADIARGITLAIEAIVTEDGASPGAMGTTH